LEDVGYDGTLSCFKTALGIAGTSLGEVGAADVATPSRDGHFTPGVAFFSVISILWAVIFVVEFAGSMGAKNGSRVYSKEDESWIGKDMDSCDRLA
jgi:hypothetical protein